MESAKERLLFGMILRLAQQTIALKSALGRAVKYSDEVMPELNKFDQQMDELLELMDKFSKDG